MVMEFGIKLRKELVKRLETTDKVQRERERTQSSDTRRLSMVSIELTERERPNPNLSKALKCT